MYMYAIFFFFFFFLCQKMQLTLAVPYAYIYLCVKVLLISMMICLEIFFEFSKNFLLFPKVYQALNFGKIKNLFTVLAMFCEIYFILQVLLYTLHKQPCFKPSPLISALRRFSSGKMPEGACIHWFRHGLRLHDNPALLEGMTLSSEFYPVFILDGEVAGTTGFLSCF